MLFNYMGYMLLTIHGLHVINYTWAKCYLTTWATCYELYMGSGLGFRDLRGGATWFSAVTFRGHKGHKPGHQVHKLKNMILI